MKEMLCHLKMYVCMYTTCIFGASQPFENADFKKILGKVAQSQLLTSDEILSYQTVCLNRNFAEFLSGVLNGDKKPENANALNIAASMPIAAATAVQSALDGHKLAFESIGNSFDNFLTPTPKHQQILASVKEFAAAPVGAGTKGSRVLFMHGPAGVGKTHLLTSLIDAFKAQGKKLLHVKDELYTYYSESQKKKSSFDLASNLAGYDVILLDDLNQMSAFDVKYVRELLLSVFDNGHKKIVITSNMSCEDFLNKLLECVSVTKDSKGDSVISQTASLETKKLVSRFNQMVTKIDFEGIETRRQ